MNANGISTVAVAGSASAATPSAGSGKAGSPGGFAGALVQAMGGMGGNGASSSGTAVPAGVLGLTGLLGAPMTEQTSSDLLKLLAGLSEQLKGLDPNNLVQAMGGIVGNGASSSGIAVPAGPAVPAGLPGLTGLPGASVTEQTSSELLKLLAGLSNPLKGLDPNAEQPADAQNQLAGLLLLLQNMLTQMGLNPTAPKADAASLLHSGSDTSTDLLLPSMQSVNMLPVIPKLQQSLMQLSALLSSGTALPADGSLFTEQLLTTSDALSPQLSAAEASIAQTAGANVSVDKEQQEIAKFTTAGMTLSPADSEQTTVAAAPEIRRSVIPLRNPVWQFQTTSGSETPKVEGTATKTAIKPSESSGQNGSAPAWTFLKGDNVGMPAAAPSMASAPAQVPVQQFAEQMGKYLVKQFVLTQGNGTHEAQISLHPEHLGQVDIKITIHNGQLTAQFITESGAARDLLDNQMSQLRTTLQEQGLHVERMEVVQQSSTTDSASFFQQNQRQPGSQQHDNGGNGSGNRGVYNDTAGFEAELERSTYLRDVGYGSSLNVRA
jgi:flagellar hook-length control protein FliK